MTDTTGFFMSLVETKPLMIATLAGACGMFLLGDNFDSALQFGALGALGASLGDFVMNYMGWSTSVESYFAASLSYVDPADGIGAAAGSAVLLYSLGGAGSQLMKEAAIIGVAGLFAPKIAGLIGGSGPLLQKLLPAQSPQKKAPPQIPKMGGPKNGPLKQPYEVPLSGPPVMNSPYGPNSMGPVMWQNPFLTQPPLENVSVK